MRKKTVTISFVTTPTIETVLRKAAEDQDRSLSWLIGEAVEKYLGIKEHPSKSTIARKPGSR